MANSDRPNGAIPVGTLSGSPWQDSVRAFVLDDSHSAIAVGDLVQMTADGYLDVYAAGETGFIGVMVGKLPAAPTTVLGKQGEHFLSADSPVLSGTAANQSAANATDTILVCTAPDAVFELQEDGDTDPLELADVGSNVEIINGGISSTTGISGMEIDSSSHATTNTLPFRLLELAQRPGNEYISGGQAATRWLVTPANHSYSGLNVGL